MDGVHDLGGVEGFGPVVVDPDEPVFAARWEQRVFGLNFAAVPANVDRFRHAIERMGAVAYLTTSYYEHWLAAIERLAVETGVVSAAELDEARRAAATGASVPRRDDRAVAEVVVRAVQTPRLPPVDESPGRHAVGDAVRVVRRASRGHTRCPRYVRGATGVVVAVRGRFRVPDASAEGREEVEPVYGVRFEAVELWGEGTHEVHLDLWERYLEPAGSGAGRG